MKSIKRIGVQTEFLPVELGYVQALSQQKGMSLIEAMITMVISSFIILGVTAVFLQNRESYMFQESRLETQSSGRYAMLIMEDRLNQAGYRRDPTEDKERAFPAMDIKKTVSGVNIDCNFKAGQVIAPGNTGSFCIRYQAANADDLDCAGGGVPASHAANFNTPYTNAQVMIVESFNLDRANTELRCTAFTSEIVDGSVVDKPKIASGALAVGIQDMVISYGWSNTKDNKKLDAYATNPAAGVSPHHMLVKILTQSATVAANGAFQNNVVLTNWTNMLKSMGLPAFVPPNNAANFNFGILEYGLTLRNPS